MDLRFWLARETGLPHIYDHDITEDEVREIMTRSGFDYSESGNARVRLGQTEAGRYLKVVYLPDEGGDSAFVVTAYGLRGKALKAYHRAKRRKRR